MLVFIIIIAVVRLHSHSGMLYSVALHACNHACLDHERSGMFQGVFGSG